LDEVYKQWCEKRGEDYEAASRCFIEEFSNRLEAAKDSEFADDDAKAQADKDARFEAMKKVSETYADKNMLLEFIHDQLDGPEQLFHFRRNYAGQLATDALIQHSCSVVERTPPRVVLLQRNGHVLTPDYRFEYNNHGECIGQRFEFMLTRMYRHVLTSCLFYRISRTAKDSIPIDTQHSVIDRPAVASRSLHPFNGHCRIRFKRGPQRP
jgi:hypothetical protein